ncbi:TIGR03857 family LLM class F420-dependent oxidoreductase [Pseudonocardia spinosispora]|uniref:TIGR03857 family LLM class F420-dependent oxidoreductase n=1 Tax=Pseudonocardia spinosispora TaxID=103441 RepID=UPI0003F6214D|nr:TIGR03857 family LLM class F420-dependent oxidoreductase [Pseudonocardia spinosispora]
MIEDLSAYVISGRVLARPRASRYVTDFRGVAEGIQDGVDAENLGFRRVFLSERWNLKEAGVLLAAIAARTSRIGVASGIITTPARHPLHAAGLGATMQAAFGDRFVLGLGRGNPGWLGGAGLTMPSYPGLRDYVDILRRLWAGEQVAYDGPAGTFPHLALEDVDPEVPAPPVWFGTLGQPLGARATAASFDGVLLPPVFTPTATATIVERLRRECERIGRDPATLRICQSVITAPDLDDTETRTIAHARAVTYLDAPGYGEMLVRLNGWDPAPLAALREHTQFRDMDSVSDLKFHRGELLGPAALVPDEWMSESCALGSVEECVATLRRFRDAGADEIATYGSTPAQNAGLARAWAARVTEGASR